MLIKKSNLFNGSEQAVIRYTFQLMIMIIIACRTHNNLLGPKESRKILIVRGVLGMTYLLSLHFSVKLISPSDSVSLVHLNIVIVSLLARVFLSEKINLAHIVSLIMSMAGVFLIAQPSFLFNKSPISFNLTFNLTENNKSNTTFRSLQLQSLLLERLYLIRYRHLALGEVSQKVCCWLLQEQ